MKAKPDALNVVIIGGGFGGLSAAQKLARAVGVEVTLIDQRNHHLFQPLLYQVATAGLSPADIAAPIRSVLSHAANVQVILGKVIEIDRVAKKVFTAESSYHYDHLILSCGATDTYFGHPEWEEFAPGLKTLEQATEIRRRILLAFELAEKETNREKQRELLSFVVVGGGPTGVELAGAISEISRHTLAQDFRTIDPSQTRVILIEAGARVLSAFSESLSKKATRDLEALGVQIWTGTRVTQITDGEVRLGSEILKAKTVLWAAGVGANPLNAKLGVPLDQAGRVIVEADLSIPGDPHVFVLGDQAHFKDERIGVLPGLAPVAMQQGRFVARLILRSLKSKPREKFEYLDKGQMATIGRRRAVLQFKGIEMAGLLAWLAWLFIHIYYLIGFKNRLVVFLQWAWSYLTFQRGARLIVDKEWRSTRK